MTTGKWYYVYGAVWTTPNGPEDGGACVAQRAIDFKVSPVDRDENMKAISHLPDAIAALKDCVQSLKRLPDAEKAYRVTCIQQAENVIRQMETQ